jgi:DDE family transposase/transposase IS4-like protein
MSFEQALSLLTEVFEPRTFTAFREQLEPSWVLQALQDTGTVSVRRRRLPAEQMVWLVIGMALLRDRSIVEVADTLDIAYDKNRKPLASSAVHQARARLKSEPMQWLFEQSAKQWADAAAEKDKWRGLGLYGLDGTSIRVADSAANAQAFGYTVSAKGQSAYPKVRMVALMALRSHLLKACAFGAYKTSEYKYAEQLWDEVPKNSLVVFDRNFFSADLLIGLQTQGRHWLMRAKSTLKPKTVRVLGPGDELCELEVSKEARKKNPSLPKTFLVRLIHYQREGFEPERLITSLLDAQLYPASEIAPLYHERWEIELGYDEIKTEMLERRETIRSKSADGVKQEIWGMLIAYNLVRLEMNHVAKRAKVAPIRISFVMALRLIRDEWMLDSMPHASPGALPKHLLRLEQRLLRFVLPERRLRFYPRAVKIKMTNYPRKRRPNVLN